MKKLIFLLLISILQSIQLSAREYSEIVIDTKTGKTLHEENSRTLSYPASLTKLMTLYLIFEQLEQEVVYMDKTLTISKKAIKQPPSKIYLKESDRITVKEAILALIVKSGNDVAMVLSEEISDREWFFTHKMNKKAKN